jgi:hypothetical protein
VTALIKDYFNFLKSKDSSHWESISEVIADISVPVDDLKGLAEM